MSCAKRAVEEAKRELSMASWVVASLLLRENANQHRREILRNLRLSYELGNEDHRLVVVARLKDLHSLHDDMQDEINEILAQNPVSEGNR